MRSRAENINRMRFDLAQVKRRMMREVRNPNLDMEERLAIRERYISHYQEQAVQLRDYARESIVHPNLR